MSTIDLRQGDWDVVPCLSPKERLHPAPFPERLATDHINTWSKPGDLVLDPFMGSGTTGVACINTGRRFIGIELDPQYFGIAEKRIREAVERRAKDHA